MSTENIERNGNRRQTESGKLNGVLCPCKVIIIIIFIIIFYYYNYYYYSVIIIIPGVDVVVRGGVDGRVSVTVVT